MKGLRNSVEEEAEGLHEGEWRGFPQLEMAYALEIKI